MHAAVAAELLSDRALVHAVLEDVSSSAIGAAERILFEFLERVNRESWTISAKDVEEVRRSGWSDEAIFDAVTVCALFNFYNRWCDATGVHDMSPRDYELSGKRTALHGYAPEG